MYEVLRVARLRLALQRAFLRRAILIFTKEREMDERTEVEKQKNLSSKRERVKKNLMQQNKKMFAISPQKEKVKVT